MKSVLVMTNEMYKQDLNWSLSSGGQLKPETKYVLVCTLQYFINKLQHIDKKIDFTIQKRSECILKCTATHQLNTIIEYNFLSFLCFRATKYYQTYRPKNTRGW
jgi:hypothetical protein